MKTLNINRTMKISQADWDHLWETSTGDQAKMFDAGGERFPDRKITMYTYPSFLLRLDCPQVSTKKKSI